MHFINTLAAALLAVYATATPISVPETNNLAERATQMDKTKVTAAMGDASGKMAAIGQSYTLIVQGGAVNVIMGNRPTTGDVDFIASNWALGSGYGETLDELKKGFTYAYKEALKRQAPIDSSWTDNSIQAFFFKNPEVFTTFKSAAMSQNKVLSNAEVDEDGDGLTWIAAPFDWQFTSKMMDQSATSPKKPYDFKDAAFYLTQYIQRNGGGDSISYTDVQKFFPKWSRTEPANLPALCDEVNKEAGSDLITGTKACGGITARFDGAACNYTMHG